jgi:lipopolysaccharide/colanic/teichoic acid biosynthesis glycosyltransferase
MSDACPWTLRQQLVKRLFDLVIALPALVVASPVIALSALAAWVDTGRSGIFSQQRVGRHGDLFTVYKIRTMRHLGSSTVTTSLDSRVTRLGRLLRASKADELPQLWNVACGQMSLVGPRPDVPGFADLLVGDERLILTVPPGITGPATLHFRDEETLLASVEDPQSYNQRVVYPAKVRMNLEYVRTQSLRTDLRYLVHTVNRARTQTATLQGAR